MNQRQFFIVIGVLVVLLAAGAGVMWSQRGEWRGSDDTRVGQRLVPGLVIAEVSEVHVKNPTDEVTIEFKDGLWRVKERGGYPGNLDRMAEFLDKLAALKITQVDPLPESQRARLQLVEPKGPDTASSATLLEIKNKAGKTTRLLLGKAVTAQSATTAPTKGGPSASGRYVAPPEPGVFVVVSDPMSQAEAKPAPWLARDLVRVVQASRMTSVGADGKVRWSASRPNESADWKSTRPEDRLDNNKLQDLVSALIYISVADVAPDASKAGFDKGVTLKVDTFNNYHYALTFGESVGDLRFLKIALEADPPPSRPPQQGEAPADKEKNDQQYLKDHDGMIAHVAREKKLEGWTFLVRDEDVKALIRDRAQLLPEPKKDDKKGETKK